MGTLTQLDLHYLKMAKMAGEKSQLTHSKRGTIIAKGNSIIAQGVNCHLDQAANVKYMGAHPNVPAAGLQDEKYIPTVNAELVAISVATATNANLSDVTLYSSDEPNWQMFKTAIVLGIKRLVYYGPAKNERMKTYGQSLGVEIIVVG